MKNIFRSVLRVLPAFVFLVILSCKSGYVLNQGTGFFHLMNQRVPLDHAMGHPDLDEQQRGKLALVPDVRSFAKKKAGLSPGDTYTSFVPVSGTAVAWNVTATPGSSLRPVTWTFPIVGSFPYLGFFERENAVELRDELFADGYDVHMRPVNAFSTLGWFSDPIYSTMLKYEKPLLVEILFHELVHQNIFFTNHVMLNESIATVIGRIATTEFLKSKHGANASIVKWTRDYHGDQIRLQGFFLNLKAKLMRVYQRDRSTSWKKQKKRRILMRVKRSYLSLLDRMKTEGWNQLLSASWNNAFVASRAVYYEHTKKIRALWRIAFDRNLRKTVHFLTSLDGHHPVERIIKKINSAREKTDQEVEPDESRKSLR